MMIAIDPGIDTTGVAVFDLERWEDAGGTKNNLGRALRAFELHYEITTSPDDELAERLIRLHYAVAEIVADQNPEVAYVEMPAYHGSYSGGTERRRGVNKLYMALGAILSGLSATTVVEMPAIRQPKKHRHELLEAAASVEDVPLPLGPRGGVPEDVWDALWVGIQALTTRGSGDRVPA